MKAYFDHSATTPLDERVLETMTPYFSEKYGNASSLHSMGQEANDAMENARKKFSEIINADGKIIFTSSGTESNNLALKGLAFRGAKKHIIVSAIEHDCVLNTAKWLQTQGFDLTIAPVNDQGIVTADAIKKLLRPDTLFVSVMHVNNEIGTINPIAEIGAVCRDNNVIFHSDLVQSFGKIPVDVQALNVDLATFSGHKFHGPKGVGALYVKNGIKLTPLLHGGGHEQGMRSSTENIPGIVGFAKAAELSVQEMPEQMLRLQKLRDKLIEEVLKIEGAWLNGSKENRVPINANFGFKYIEGESLILLLDEAGFECSTGSACSSHTLQASHVLLATGLKPEEAHGSLRITLGKQNTEEEINAFIGVLPKVIEKLRELSPLKKDRVYDQKEVFDPEDD